jgi:hypothetical protein
MASSEHLEKLEQGVETWNQWRHENPEIAPNLSGVDLNGAYLSGADLSEANLRGADLSEANLRGANLSEALLNSANLSGANLNGADLRRAYLIEAALRRANLGGANLSGANLSGANLIETKLKRANLTGCYVYGVSAWNVELNETLQRNLIITRKNEPAVMVDDLEVAQFVYLLLHHDRLRNILNAVTENGVLILGRFGGGGIEMLRAMADRFRELSYIPIIFEFDFFDLDRPRDRTYTETIKILIGMSRFVIVDLSGPTIPQELYSTVPHFKLPFVTILEAGRRGYSMFADLLENQNVLEPVEFENQEQLLEMLPEKIIAPAEELVADRQEKLAELFGRKGA